ncbi:MAG: diaminopimelate epimerase [Proteobacteria bacterium]|jgi:diaminopimelate epimerase|nr:diaminopimelate epimerase [Pseudomonadota bacterium]
MIVRMSGAGNTFTIEDQLEKDPLPGDFSEQARKLCSETPKTDGYLILWRSHECDFQWDFYNNDGSNAEMCGNAARCASRYFLEKKNLDRCTFRTRAGLISGSWKSKSEGLICVTLTPISDIKSHFKAETKIGPVIGTFINSGVPHFVIERKPERSLAQELRASLSFGPQGANITFSQPGMGQDLKVVTFERGVEDFTMACGTGAVAAAFTYFEKNSSDKSVVIEMPGGKLEVTQSHPPTLTGPTKYIEEHL